MLSPDIIFLNKKQCEIIIIIPNYKAIEGTSQTESRDRLLLFLIIIFVILRIFVAVTK